MDELIQLLSTNGYSTTLYVDDANDDGVLVVERYGGVIHITTHINGYQLADMPHHIYNTTHDVLRALHVAYSCYTNR